MKDLFINWKTPLILSLTLGLAPFRPEPHIFGKLRWITGGARGMEILDWLDAILHGTPWIWLFLVVIIKIIKVGEFEFIKNKK